MDVDPVNGFRQLFVSGGEISHELPLKVAIQAMLSVPASDKLYVNRLT